MAELGKNVQVEEDMPLLTYVIQYQKLLHEDAEKILERNSEDQAVYIEQLIKDFETSFSIKLENESKNISQKYLDAEMKLNNKFDVQMLNFTQIIYEGVKLHFDNTVAVLKQENVDAHINLTRNLEHHIRNATVVSESLEQKITDVEHNLYKKLNKQISNLKQEFHDSQRYMTHLMESYIENATLVFEKLDEATHLSRNLENEIISLKQELHEEIQITKNLSDEMRIIKEINKLI